MPELLQQEITSHQAGARTIFDELQETDARCGIGTYKRFEVAFVRGQGARLWDTSGQSYLDFLGGLAVALVGHCHPHVTDAITRQANTLVHSSNLFYIEPQVRLAEKLASLSGGMRSFFCNSGAEANEAALKLARKYQQQRGATDRNRIVSLLGSFHGRTYGSLAATGQPRFHDGFAPMPEGFDYTPVNDLHALQQAVGPSTAAVLLEPIQGEIGVEPLDPAFMQEARCLCDEQGALLMMDEVQCGLGRTGRFFAHEWAAVQADVITLAKGLGNGVPIGAMMARPGVAEAFTPGDHGCTFGGNFLSCAAALATLEVLEREQLLARATAMGDLLQSRLAGWLTHNDLKGTIHGRGLMVGVWLEEPIARMLCVAAMRHGLVFNAVGTNRLRFLPPLVVGEPDIGEMIELLQAATNDVKAAAD